MLAVTRENNRGAIEQFMAKNPASEYSNITFLYFDLPYYMRFWKKGNRGAMLYFYLWQKGIVSFVKKKKLSFDIAHNVNFHNDWTPSFLWKLNKPLVWGPIGHHPLIPKMYLKPYSVSYSIKDSLTWLVKKMFWHYSTSLNKTKKNAAHIWCMNDDVPVKLNLKTKNYSVFPSVASEDYYGTIEFGETEGFHVISAGRFVPLKGFDLTIRSFIKFLERVPYEDKESCKLTLVGSGPEKGFYEQLIKDNSAKDNIEIIEWIERKELMKLYAKSSVFMFPSHEGAGMVVAEALSFGLPVVCLDNIGPGQYITPECGFIVPQTNYDETVSELNNTLYKLYNDRQLLAKMSISARERYNERFTWDSRGQHLNKIYNTISL